MGTSTDQLSTDELRREIAGQRDDIGRDLTAIGDRLSPGRVADRSKERARQRVTSWRDRVMGPAQQVKTSIGSAGQGTGDRIGDQAGSAVQAATDRIEGSPIAVGLVAFGIGFIAGSALPASRPERQLAQSIEPQVEQLAAQVSGAAREVVEEAAPAVQDELGSAREEAAAAAGNVVDSAKDEAAAARQDVQGG